MAINTYPAVASPIKSVQRGSAAGAGTVTITAVDINKSFVNIQGTSSSGTVAVSGGINAASGANNAMNISKNRGINAGGYGNWRYGGASNTATSVFSDFMSVNAGSFNINATNINAGSNNLVAAQVQGYLSNSTSLVVSGACRWEVVEYN